jgi:DNA-binding MarR family transcriptional regulator
MKSQALKDKMAAQIEEILKRLNSAARELRTLDALALNIDSEMECLPDEKAVAAARAVLYLWKSRGSFFDRQLLEDPGWFILINLKIAELTHQKTAVSALCIDSGVAATTALRWIQSMEALGLLESKKDPFDLRRRFILLSPEASATMDRYLANVSAYLASSKL